MTMTCDLGFRIVGDCTGDRRLINWAAAFRAYLACDEKAEVGREAYLSAFTFGSDFGSHLEETGSTRNFDGLCRAGYLWFDIDRAEGELETARRDTARLALSLVDRYSLDEDSLLLFFSGAKGFHIGLPVSLWHPEPSLLFHRQTRRLAEGLAESASVTIDTGVFDKVRAFRAPNSRHRKTGLHKRPLPLDALMRLSVERIVQLACEPAPTELPDVPSLDTTAQSDWMTAGEAVSEALKARTASTVNATSTLNRRTLEFIRDGATTGDRHRLLFSAAANLAEFDCPSELAHALLTDAAFDSGLAPAEVRRQIECGLKHQIPRSGSLFPPPDDGGLYDPRS